MSITRKRIKILFYGNCYGAYRTQNLIKFCLDQGYRFFLVSPEVYFERGSSKDFISKISRLIFSNYYLLELFIKACLVDVIYLLPVNIHLIKSALFISRLLKKELICEMHVSLYDTHVREKQDPPPGTKAAAALRHKDSLALSQPEYLINPAQYEVQHWEKNLGVEVDYNRLFVVPLFCEPIPSAKLNYSRTRASFEICWWGTFHPLHGIENMLTALSLLKEKEVIFECNLFGIPPTGQDYILDKYKQLIIDLGIQDHVFLRRDLNFFDQSLPKYLAQHCDLALGIFGNTDKAKSTVPTKLIDALSIGLPTLTMNSPALGEFFDVQIDLWTCDDISPESIYASLYKIYLNQAFPVDWKLTREKTLMQFNLERYTQTVSELFQAVEGKL